MDQYHQQLQQAQKHYQQNGNPVILAPPSHAPRTSYARNTDPRSAPQQPSYGPSGRPSVTASGPSTSHVSDSHRSNVGAISLPDSGYHHPSYSSSLEPGARGSPVVHTSTSDQRTNRTAPQRLPSSGVKSSLSADSGTQFFIPPGQPQKSPLNSTNTSSSPSVRAIGNPSARAPRQTLTGSTPNTSGRSSIHTAPPITPVSSDSPIVSFSNSTRSALEPTYKTAGAPVRQTTGAATMTSADDIVADSEGEEDVVQGTLDVRDVARNQVSGSDIEGLRKWMVKTWDWHKLDIIHATPFHRYWFANTFSDGHDSCSSVHVRRRTLRNPPSDFSHQSHPVKRAFHISNRAGRNRIKVCHACCTRIDATQTKEKSQTTYRIRLGGEYWRCDFFNVSTSAKHRINTGTSA